MSWLFLALFCLSCFGSSADAAVVKDSVGIVKDSFAPIILPASDADGVFPSSINYRLDGDSKYTRVDGASISISSDDDIDLKNIYFNSYYAFKKNDVYSVSIKVTSSSVLGTLNVDYYDDNSLGTYALQTVNPRSRVNGDLTEYFYDFDIVPPYDGGRISVTWLDSGGSFSGSFNQFYFVVNKVEIQSSDTGGLFSSIIKAVTNIWEGITQLPQKIGAAFQQVGQFILDGIKNLFLPSDDFFNGYWEQLNDFFSDRFGLLYFPIELTVDMVNRILKISQTDPYIQIPELAWDGHVFIPAQRYEFDFLDNPQFKQIHDYYLMAMDVAMIGALVALLWRKFEEVLKT